MDASTTVQMLGRTGLFGALSEADREEAGQLLLAAASYARQRGIEKSGYRVVGNVGPDAGQSVFHLHLHLLGGKSLHANPDTGRGD